MGSTRTDNLSREARRWYFAGRVLLYAFFIAFVGWILVKTIFPDGGGEYDFAIYGANKNTLSDPVFSDGSAAEDGTARAGQAMIFGASAHGDFSRADVEFFGDFSQESESIGTLSLVRAYQAYLYPEGDPIVCPRDGSLVKVDGEYGMASGGQLRFFASVSDAERAGYELRQFQEFSADAVSACRRGEALAESEDALQDMITTVDGQYFQFIDGEWHAFASERAFLSRYRKEDALPIAQEVFDRYPIAEEKVGFLSGMLVSYGESVYVVEGDTLRGVADPETFVTKGYAWEDVLPLTDEEFGAYVIGDYYSRKRTHASGTVFVAEGSGEMFVVDGGTKRRIANAQLEAQYGAVHAISANVTELGTCVFRGAWSSQRCEIAWDGKAGGIGSEYRFQFKADENVKLSEMRAAFVREKSRANFNSFAAEILARLGSRYPFLQ